MIHLQGRFLFASARCLRGTANGIILTYFQSLEISLPTFLDMDMNVQCFRNQGKKNTNKIQEERELYFGSPLWSLLLQQQKSTVSR